MDILNDNNDNDDAHMADSDSSSEDGINHERLRQLSNYADQNEDDPTWYWNGMSLQVPNHIQYPAVGWPTYRPLSSLSEVERKEIRNGENKMVSYKDQERYEGSGISLDWGEYYVADDDMDSSDDDEQCSLSLHEEADEIIDEQFDREVKKAHISIINDASQSPSEMNYDQLDSFATASSPTLTGMPDIVLEKILHYSTEQPSEVFVVERVCKRIRRLTSGEDFWRRHPSSKDRSLVLAKTYKKDLPENSPHFRESLSVWLQECKEDISDLPFSRQLACDLEAIGKIRRFQSNDSTVILDVLGKDGVCAASIFRTLSADILSSMNYLGPEAHFRLRGDTIGYISELLQGYMIDRLQIAIHLAFHKLEKRDGATEDSIRCVVREDDIALAFQKDVFSPFFCGFSPQRPPRCNVAKGDHVDRSLIARAP